MAMKGVYNFQEQAITVNLPFERITSRAVIVRRRDGALLGVLHRQHGQYAPPGGHMENGESPDETVLRELGEENIRLINPDEGWRKRMVVDYFGGTLNIWYIFVVDDAQIGYSEELVESRWVEQSLDVWYPTMREKILLMLAEHAPDMMRIQISLLETW